MQRGQNVAIVRQGSSDRSTSPLNPACALIECGLLLPISDMAPMASSYESIRER